MGATEITKHKSLMYASSGIQEGMILSEINNMNVLGLPFNIVKQKLMESIYPIQLAFMSEKTVLVRFDWVLSAASFINHALKQQYDEINIMKFLAHEGMTKLEVRSAVHLKNEHVELLPRVKLVNSSIYLSNEMNGNALYSLFMESKWSRKRDVYKNDNAGYSAPVSPNSPASLRQINAQKLIASELFLDETQNENDAGNNSDSSVAEAMGDMLDMFGLNQFDDEAMEASQNKESHKKKIKTIG